MSIDDPRSFDNTKIISFLQKVTPMIEVELDASASSHAFGSHVFDGDSGKQEVTLWRTLCPDLEKHKVRYI